MKVYHGSYIPVEKPDTVHSRRNVDFGPGFYVTPIYEQAEKWSVKFKNRGRSAVISAYTFNECACDELKTLVFKAYTEEWLTFIASCRTGNDTSDYDIVMGGVADDKVFNTVELFFDGLIDIKDAIGRLRYESPNLQICFRTQEAIDKYLKFEGSETI